MIDFTQRGISQPAQWTALSSTNATDVFTPTGKGVYKIALIKVCNVDTGNTCRLDLFWNDGTNNNQFYEGQIAAGTTVDIEAPFRVGTSDAGEKARKLVATAENADDLTITVFAVLDTPIGSPN